MPCDCRTGRAVQETVDGAQEVFQCDAMLQPGALATVIAHLYVADITAPIVPRTWVFCADPLCVVSHPAGTNLPPA